MSGSCPSCGERTTLPRLCKTCKRIETVDNAMQTQTDGGDVYHKASSPAAANIARHINGIRHHFQVPDDASDLRALSDFTDAIRNHDLTQREVKEELHALKTEYENRFPEQSIDGIRFDPVSFNVRHALQWANSYPEHPQETTGAGVVTDPDGSPDHPEVNLR